MDRDINILIVDPDEDMQDLFFRALANQKNFRCFVAKDKKEAVRILNSFTIDLILLDISIVLPSHFDLVREFASLCPHAILIVNGSIHQMRHLKDSISMGAHGYFIKPISLYSLRKIVTSFAKKLNLSPESYEHVSS
ncbi:MAG: response regulator [Syntrophobacterales bacterium]|nr:response regulator [Syntrophobacterales bacterium]